MKPGHRRCFYLDESWTVLGPTGQRLYRPSVVEENVVGHSPTTYSYGPDFERAKAFVDDLNAALGLSPGDVDTIVMSSMRVQNEAA